MFHSIQGEGASIGANAVFLRTAGCNLAGKCMICDSKYSWKAGEEMGNDKVIDYLNETNANTLVITGGEPLMQLDAVIGLIREINTTIALNKNISIEIETNGSIFIDAYNVFKDTTVWGNLTFNISPKLASVTPDAYDIAAIKDICCWSKGAILKFVITSEEDLKEVLEIQEAVDVESSEVYLMPEGVTKEEQEARQLGVIEMAKKHGFNFSPRTHILIWDNKRGV
jgi:7-carboxy-7-deazaguanine synthase